METKVQQTKQAKPNWFKRHLNWTLVITWLGGSLAYIALMLFALLNGIIIWLTPVEPRVTTSPKVTSTIPTVTAFPKGITEIRRGKFEVKEVEGIPENPGIVSWRQGLFWVSVMPPYREGNIDIVYSKEPPPVAKRRRGKPKKTVYTWRGRPPEHLKVDIGAFDASVKRGKSIRFERDTEVITKGKLLPGTISRKRKGKYERPAFVF